MEKKISISLPEEVREILGKLHNSGFDSYIVGGCVRDSILGREPKDWDVTTNAKPEEIIEVFKDYKTVLTGIEYGTVVVVINSQNFEVTTYRIDGEYKDGRHPEGVYFVNNLVSDLSRRDFTMNAMAYRPEVLIDPFNGYEDIENKTIRCVGEPLTRFDEDALRMMRAIRFSSELESFTISPKTWEAICSNPKGIEKVSYERIRDEFNKILLSEDNTAFGIFNLQVSKLAQYFLPELEDLLIEQNNKYHKFNLFNHMLHAVYCIKNEEVLKLAAFFHDFGKPQCKTTDVAGIDHFYNHAPVSAEMTEKIMTRLRYDKATIFKVVTLVAHHDFTPVDSKKSVRKMLNKLGEDLFFDLMELKKADILSHSEESQYQFPIVEAMIQIAHQVIEEQLCFSLKDLAINGNDLIDLGMKPDRMFSAILNGLLEMVINEELENTREALLEFIG